MSGSVNKVILVCRLGRDPEVRNLPDGSKVVSLSVVTSESWKDKPTGDRKERAEWHKVSIFNDRLGDVAERFLRKGSRVYLEGSLQTKKWTNQAGQEVYSTEVVLQRFRGELTLLDSRSDGQGSSDAPSANTTAFPKKAAGKGLEDLNDSIPF